MYASDCVARSKARSGGTMKRSSDLRNVSGDGHVCPLCEAPVTHEPLASHVTGHIFIEVWMEGNRLTRPGLAKDGTLWQQYLELEFESPDLTAAMTAAELATETGGRTSCR